MRSFKKLLFVGTYIKHSLTLFSVKEVVLSAKNLLFMVVINSTIPDCLPKDSQKSAPHRTIRGANLYSSPS